MFFKPYLAILRKPTFSWIPILEEFLVHCIRTVTDTISNSTHCEHRRETRAHWIAFYQTVTIPRLSLTLEVCSHVRILHYSFDSGDVYERYEHSHSRYVAININEQWCIQHFTITIKCYFVRISHIGNHTISMRFNNNLCSTLAFLPNPIHSCIRRRRSNNLLVR